MPLINYPWRQQWQPASFRGAVFHVETDARAGGRRIALHEFPKRNLPYAEDMGRRAFRHPVTGYVIMSPRNPNYLTDRDALLDALDIDGPGTLVHPLLGTMTVLCDQYSATESRERGGYCAFEMIFIEAGAPSDIQTGTPDSQYQVSQNADNVESTASQSLDNSAAPLPVGANVGFVAGPH
jgi:prophage DNA circulation protein